MVLLLCAFLSATPTSDPAKAEQRAHVSVRILNPYRASAAGWKPAVRRNQREIMKREKDGTSLLIRLTEFE